ncbi:MAG: selenide, water dikinase SelD [Candidatus Marinimicrobia bacterium]|nr:selenide, water dikinase SelD [Candidatus Neomarinimicrobiota bacterium]
MQKVYLDYNASTPLARRVIEKMKPYLEKGFGNPSSAHWSGLESKQAIEKARQQLAEMLGCDSEEIIFTSGGSESNNLAIRGIANKYSGGHIITSEIEHPAVMNVCKYLEKKDFSVSYLPVNKNGIIQIEELEKTIRPDTKLITIMLANNEIGTIQPISEVCQIAQKYNIPVHTDAAQAAGKIKLNVSELEADLLSIAGHKMYAPKGVGALYIRSGIEIEPILMGADHERGLRPGTENVLEIVGLGEAAALFRNNGEKFIDEQKQVKQAFWKKLKSELPSIELNGDFEMSLPNTLNIHFSGLNANTLLSAIPEIAASAGAACHADNIAPSHVLKAIGLSDQESMECIRFSVARKTTREDIKYASQRIIKTNKSLRIISQVKKEDPDASKIKLTQYTHGLGCACKLKPQNLEQIINKIDNIADPNIVTGIIDSEDAAVYKINNNTAIISSVDFFTPIVDDAFDFGRIAAANALSDIYAMGGTPLFALNIAAFPENRLPLSVLENIIEGAQAVAKEAGITILGGHTIEDNEPKFGLVVIGTINPKGVLTNNRAQPDDTIILTKPLGLGIQTTAVKRNLLEQTKQTSIIEIMTTLNKQAAEIISNYPVNSCTDVTGFGLLGHLNEILAASQLNAELYHKSIPIINGTQELVRQNVIPGGTRANLNYIQDKVEWSGLSETKKLILTDAQTSGGLLLTIPEKFSKEIVNRLHVSNCSEAAIIGRIKSNLSTKITIE